MSYFFGTRIATDAWLMASALPNLLFSTMNGAISVTVIPLLTDSDISYSKRSVDRFLNEVFTVLFVVSVVLIGFGEIFTPDIVRLMAPGFHGQELAETIQMTRLMVPTILFWGFSGLLVGILQKQEDYFYPALSPVAVNIIRIATIIVLGSFMGIQGVALGFTLAVMSQLFILIPALRRHGIHIHFRWHFGHPLLKRMARMALPFFLTSSVGSIGVIVDRILASNLAHGSLAALNYSYVLVQIPIGLIISSLATPIYTRLAQHHSHQDDDTFHLLAMRGFRLVLMIIVPLTIWFLVLRFPILRLLYQRGAFNSRSTTITAGTLFYFSLGLPGWALSFYLQRLFFATKDTKSPARYSIITILFNIVGDLIMVRVMKVDGLALATAAAAWVNATLLTTRALRPRYNPGAQLRRTSLSILTGGALMVGATYGMRHVIGLDQLTGTFHLLSGLLATVLVSGLVFLLWLRIFRYPDLTDLLSRYRPKTRGHQ